MTRIRTGSGSRGLSGGSSGSRGGSSRPSSSGGSSRPSSSRPSSSRPSGSGSSSKPNTASDMLSGGPDIKERPYVNPNVPPNKPLPATPSSKPSTSSNRPSSSSKPDAETGAKPKDPKDGKNKPKREGPDADTVIDAAEVAIYAADVLGEDEQFNQEGGATNNNNNEAPRQEDSRPREEAKEDEDPVSKPLEEKVKNNGLQQAAQTQQAAESGDSGVGEKDYLDALALVNRYEQFGCSQKSKPNPINQPPKKKYTGVANF